MLWQESLGHWDQIRRKLSVTLDWLVMVSHKRRVPLKIRSAAQPVHQPRRESHRLKVCLNRHRRMLTSCNSLCIYQDFHVDQWFGSTSRRGCGYRGGDDGGGGCSWCGGLSLGLLLNIIGHYVRPIICLMYLYSTRLACDWAMGVTGAKGGATVGRNARSGSRFGDMY